MTVQLLGEEAVRRYSKLQKQDDIIKEKRDREKVQEIRKTRGGVILDPDDRIRDVLDDNDFVTVGKRNCVLRQYIYIVKWEVENVINHRHP
jgi:histidine ammonia-lyase